MPRPAPSSAALDALRLATAIAYVMPGASVEVAGEGTDGTFGPGPGQVPLQVLRQALGTALVVGSTGALSALVGDPGELAVDAVALRTPADGTRSVGAGCYEITWAGRVTCLFATTLAERDARAAVRAAATYPSSLHDVPVGALGLAPAPGRVAVVRDEPTATTLFALDRAVGGHATVTWLVRGAMVAAHAACLVAALEQDLASHSAWPT